MRQLFQELVADGELVLQRLVAERRQEAVDLDFKTKADPSKATLGDDDRRVLGRTLSAFSNSMGGVIVYGVDARKNADGIDCATALQPIADIERFQNEFVRATGELLMPRHEGITVESVAAANGDGKGYLALYVERSERRPHRSEAKGDKQYYKRSGESSFAMEHFDIEDMFRRVTVAVLDLEWHLEPYDTIFGDGGTGEVRVAVVLSLRNSSNTTARFPYLHVVTGNFFPAGAENRSRSGLPRRIEQNLLLFEGGADHVINPGIVRRTTRLIYTLPRQQHSNPPLPDLTDFCGVAVEYGCGCEHSPIRNGRIQVTADAVRDLYPSSN